ncbi:MAG: TIGR04282 family arsenosugar biosynthesis glycosyltransferase [Geobacter sp.]|nr:TIGR04282 family arsenosugar biosynthesis glycosyltransferase [Geobacter sp.]
MLKTSRKALIIFAKRPIAGRVKTRIFPHLSLEEAAELYRCMLEDILEKVLAISGVDRHVFYEPGEHAATYFAQIAPQMNPSPQKGNVLGERMANAFAEMFSAGYEHVAIMGTDIPDLPLKYVKSAFKKLESNECDAVFGPSDDGGYYLLAMGKLYPDLFREIRWSSGEVLETSIERANTAGIRVSLLPTWHDVDTGKDLERPELLDEGNGAPRTREFIKKSMRN